MGKLTTEVFNESCCDGGSSPSHKSAQPCGCDEGANYECERHKHERKVEELINEGFRDRGHERQR